MAPSQLQIATSVLQRLVKEEASYHKELEQQQARIAKLEAKAKAKQDGNGAGEEDDDDDGNAEFQLKQEVCVFFPHLIHRSRRHHYATRTLPRRGEREFSLARTLTTAS